MDDPYSALYEQLSSPSLSLEAKVAALKGNLDASSPFLVEEKRCKQIRLFYDRILQARFGPFKSVLEEFAYDWAFNLGRASSTAAVASQLSSTMLWAMIGLGKTISKKAAAILLKIMRGLIEGDEALKASQTVQSVVGSLLKLKIDHFNEVVEEYLAVWDSIRKRYPSTFRSQLSSILLSLVDNGAISDAIVWSSSWLVHWRAMNAQALSDLIDKLLVKIRLVQDVPACFSAALHALNQAVSVADVDTKVLDLVGRAVFHCRYRRSSNAVLEEIIQLSAKTAKDSDFVKIAICHQMGLLLSQSDNIERTTELFLASPLDLSCAAAIGSPFMSMRRLLILKGDRHLAEKCLLKVSELARLDVEVGQVFTALMGRAPLLAEPSDKISLVKAYSVDDLSEVLVEDLPYCDSSLAASILEDEEFKLKHRSTWTRLYLLNESNVTLDPAMLKLCRTDSRVLMKLLSSQEWASDPDFLLPLLDEPSLSARVYTLLVSRLDETPAFSNIPYLNGSRLRLLVYSAEELSLRLAALSLYLKLGLPRDNTAATLVATEKSFNSELKPDEIERAAEKLVHDRLSFRIGNLSTSLRLLSERINTPCMAVLAVRLHQKLTSLMRFEEGDLLAYYRQQLDSIEAWFHGLGLFPTLIDARCFPQAYYVLKRLEKVSSEHLKRLAEWALETGQADFAESLCTANGMELSRLCVTLLTRDEALLKLLDSFDPLRQHPSYYAPPSETAVVEEDDFECLHITSPKPENVLHGNPFVGGLHGIAQLWDERWYALLLRLASRIFYNSSGLDSLVKEMNSLFLQTFADRSRIKTLYERQMTEKYGIQVHRLVLTLTAGNESMKAGILEQISLLIKAMGKAVQSSRKLKLDDIWPEAKNLLEASPFKMGDKLVVDISPDVYTINSRSYPKRIDLVFEDGSKAEYLLKSGDLRIEARMSELFKLCARLCDIKLVIPTVVLLSDVGLVEWIEARSCSDLLRAHSVRTGISVEAYRADKEKSFAEFTSRVTSDLLLSYFYGKNGDILIEEQLASELAFHSAVQYVFGLGDRHLGNILALPQGSLVHVDLAMCFGEGARQTVPETTPFRLSKIFLGLLGPHHFLAFKRAFVLYLQKMREGSHLIRGSLQAFIEDPLDAFAGRDPAELVEECMARLRTCSFEGVFYEGDEQLVDALIAAVTDESRLAAMYEGWQAWI